MIYVIEYKMDGRRQTYGEWYATRAEAVAQARSNADEFGWQWRLPGWAKP